MRNQLRQLASRRFLGFALVGGSVALMGSILLWLFVGLFGWNEQLSFTLQLGATLVLNFWLNHGVIFRDRYSRNWLGRFWKFFVTRSATLVMSWCMFALLMAWDWGIPAQYQVANWTCIGFGMAFNFFTSNRFVFTLATSVQPEGE